ncbi:MAG: magnesium transporter [Methylacidiphilales bacterium]|nr:magnesium transporter [Candidatus Methylacidiphilales bacterium]
MTREHGAEADGLPLRDENGDIRAEVSEAVAAAVASADAPRLRELFADLHAADQSDLLLSLDPADQPRLIELLGDAFDFAALTELDETVRTRIVEALETRTIVEGMRELESDDAVYILEDLDKEDQDEILDQLPALDRVTLSRSLDYPEDSAGRRMQTEFVAVPAFWTVGQTIDHLRETEDLPDRFYEIFVVDPRYQLLGAVPLDVVLRTKRPVAMADIVSEEWHQVKATDDQADVARLFERYNWVSAPVVDDSDRLVGVITVDDVVDVIEEEADADLKALGGVKADEELSDSVWYIAKSRFSWLFLNLLTAILASVVIGLFEGQIEKMVALAVLMPIVASQGGNAGTQTMTVAVRALATRELGHANARRIVLREVAAGLLNGLAFAVIMGAVAVAWFGVPDLGLVIGLAMVIVLAAAALGGILIPLALHKLGADPAVSSGPFVTTVTDVVGFFAFLGIAALWFGLQ